MRIMIQEISGYPRTYDFLINGEAFSGFSRLFFVGKMCLGQDLYKKFNPEKSMSEMQHSPRIKTRIEGIRAKRKV